VGIYTNCYTLTFTFKRSFYSVCAAVSSLLQPSLRDLLRPGRRRRPANTVTVVQVLPAVLRQGTAGARPPPRPPQVTSASAAAALGRSGGRMSDVDYCDRRSRRLSFQVLPGVETLGDPRNIVLDGSPISPRI